MSGFDEYDIDLNGDNSNIVSWLTSESGFPNFRIIDKTPTKGHCGCVFFLKHRYSGGKIAIKTIDHPILHHSWLKTALSGSSNDKLFAELESFNSEHLEHFDREVRIGLSLPSCVNVVRTYDVKRFIVNRDGSTCWNGPENDKYDDAIKLPIIRMDCWDGSLQELMKSEKFDLLNRYFSLAQAMNGLIFLYTHGVQAHGDLKPRNLLWREEKDLFGGGDEPRPMPTIVGIADFGWSNVWNYFEGSKYQRTAERCYLSPERILGQHTEVNAAADVFSFGIIAAELLQNNSPYSKSSIKSDSKWLRYIENNSLSLDEIESDNFREILKRRTSYKASDRPLPEEILIATCEEVARLGGPSYQAVFETLKLWRCQDRSNQISRLTTSLEMVSEISATETEELIVSSLAVLKSTALNTLEDGVLFSLLAHAAVKACETIHDDISKPDIYYSELSDVVLLRILKPSTELDLVKLKSLKIRGTPHLDDTHFWTFSNTVAVASDAYLLSQRSSRYEELDDISNSKILPTSLMRAAYCFGRAQQYMLTGGEKLAMYCDWSIRMDPGMAEPYALRGKFPRQNIYYALLNNELHGEECGLTNQELVAYFSEWRTDLEKACELLTGWTLSRDWLDELNRNHEKYM